MVKRWGILAMSFHKHGRYSFTIVVSKMIIIGGDDFVADITGLRVHDATGKAQPLELPNVPEQYGSTAPEAEARAADVMSRWLDQHAPDARPMSLVRSA